MDNGFKAMLVQKGGDILGDLVRSWMLSAPRAARTTPVATCESSTKLVKVEEPKSVEHSIRVVNQPAEPMRQQFATNELSGDKAKEIDYRWECITKHLGGASVLLREAFERANDNNPGDGSAEKVMEALAEHAGAESDLDAMMATVKPDSTVAQEINKMYSGIRQFRAAAWKSDITIGGGTKDDITAGREWNNLMLQSAYNNAKKNKGSTCVATGM